MRKILSMALLLMAMMLIGCGDSKEVDKFIIGIDDNFAPIAFHNDKDELVGFDIDLAKEAAKRLGVKFEFKPIDWDKKREELTSGNIDIIWNGLDITEERKEYMIFSKPYMDDRQILMVRKGNNSDIRSLGDITEKIVGVQSGSTSEEYINHDENLRNSLGGFKIYMNYSEVVNALKTSEIDVIICDELAARYEINTHPDELEIIDVTIGDTAKMAVGFRKEDVELRDKVQKVFEDMIRDGTARKISEQWFNSDVIRQW